MDFLCSRPEVNPERIGVEGMSQGGGLSLATAALDSRIVACASDAPFLCHWSGASSRFRNGWRNLSRDKVLSILSYADVMNLMDRIRCPAHVSMGLLDEVYSPALIQVACNRIQSPKKIYYYPYGRHADDEWSRGEAREMWLREMLVPRD